MNYRHAFHAGNYADVLKHALLLRLVRALQRKDKGFLFLDTHAGRGRYDLSQASRGDSLEREPEWPGGIGRLWSRADAPAEVAEYLALVRSYDRSQGNLAAGPRFYPGSPGWPSSSPGRRTGWSSGRRKGPSARPSATTWNGRRAPPSARATGLAPSRPACRPGSAGPLSWSIRLTRRPTKAGPSRGRSRRGFGAFRRPSLPSGIP